MVGGPVVSCVVTGIHVVSDSVVMKDSVVLSFVNGSSVVTGAVVLPSLVGNIVGSSVGMLVGHKYIDLTEKP